MSSYPNLDGPEQRRAYEDELLADTELGLAFPAEPPLSDSERIEDLKGLLADLAFGAEMQLQVQLGGMPKWVRAYLLEVKRVAAAGAVV